MTPTLQIMGVATVIGGLLLFMAVFYFSFKSIEKGTK